MEENKVNISYSRLSTYLSCPHKYKLKYLDGHDEKIPNIDTLIGDCIHISIQTYLAKWFGDDDILKDVNRVKYIQDLFYKEIQKYIEENPSIKGVIDSNMLEEYYLGGLNILERFVNNKTKYFNPSTQELVNIEYDLSHPINTNYNFHGFIDILIKEGNRYIIWDIKTSNNGWSKFNKTNETTLSQLILYKKFLSESLSIPIQNIECKYLICKKLNNNKGMIIDVFEPITDNRTITKCVNTLSNFIYNENNTKEYPKLSGKNGYNCRFCSFVNDDKLCNSKERKQMNLIEYKLKRTMNEKT